MQRKPTKAQADQMNKDALSQADTKATFNWQFEFPETYSLMKRLKVAPPKVQDVGKTYFC